MNQLISDFQTEAGMLAFTLEGWGKNVNISASAGSSSFITNLSGNAIQHL
jgi:hypothetical protein